MFKKKKKKIDNIKVFGKFDNDKFDVLNWSRLNHTKYLVLSLIAKNVFAISASTLASEYVFSTESCILDTFRNSMGLKIVEKLVCAQNWLRYSPVYVDHHLEVSIKYIEYYDNLELGNYFNFYFQHASF